MANFFSAFKNEFLPLLSTSTAVAAEKLFRELEPLCRGKKMEIE